MSNRYEWLSARYTVVTGHAHPGEIENDGNENGAAAILITSEDGDGLVIEGRPEDLVDVARRILAVAEEIVVDTMRDPALRSLYGITAPGPLAERLVEIDPGAVLSQPGTEGGS